MSDSKGKLVETEVLYLATEYGIKVSLPFGGQERYDQIWDVNGKLLKIQIKHAQLSEDGSHISLSCQSKKRYEEGEIDAVVTCWDGKLYYIPFDEVNRSSKKKLYFNLTPEVAMKSQLSQINWALYHEWDYQTENI